MSAPPLPRSLLCLALLGCGPSDVELKELGITVTTPSGWSVDMSKFSLSDGDGEMKKGSKTFGFIGKGVTIPFGADRKLWPKQGPHTLEQLQAAFAPLQPSDPETFANGFGLQYEKDGKPKFMYVAQKGDAEYSCSPNDWIAKEDVPAAISICKSIR